MHKTLAGGLRCNYNENLLFKTIRSEAIRQLTAWLAKAIERKGKPRNAVGFMPTYKRREIRYSAALELPIGR